MTESTTAGAPKEELELEHHPGPRQYVNIAIILAVVTGAEVAVYYITAVGNLLVPLLVVFSAIKFVLVVSWYMHLKFDSRVFRRLFVAGLALAFAVFAVVLLSFFLHEASPAG